MAIPDSHLIRKPLMCLENRNGLIAILTTRSRLIVNYVEGGYKGLNFAFEQKNYVTEFFRPLLLAYPSVGGGSEEINNLAERCSRNNSENEPAFVVLGLAMALSTHVPSKLGIQLVYTYTACRFVHNIMFALLPGMPQFGPSIRSLAFITSLMIMFALGVIAILAVW
jgi:uncharacterized MAPEG superfamily protein